MEQLTINKMQISAVKCHTSNVTRFSRGFTLMETLVAISILLVAVVGPISLIGDALHKLYYAKDEMIAINLAQEGIEAVRQIRDSNKLAGAPWLTGMANGDYTVDMGKLSSAQPVITYRGTPTTVGPQPIYFDASSGLYRQETGATLTQFSRIVTIQPLALPADQRRVSSTVTWRTGGQTGTITVTVDIFNWQI
ncbi:MAG: prepilin-type N-terminal cleavage/methylation domain-containing protein [Candidatus Pacebacteria bacterium]|jgi:prepilin-type N-terminal cleavage/methylation domain-containing protein|nr:prepilin-type N-terminal cleavage/methylation domain-containing protein [Candidatus Paceibacterota bacterium]